jgi:hypothetical protein
MTMRDITRSCWLDVYERHWSLTTSDQSELLSTAAIVDLIDVFASLKKGW